MENNKNSDLEKKEGRIDDLLRVLVLSYHLLDVLCFMGEPCSHQKQIFQFELLERMCLPQAFTHGKNKGLTSRKRQCFSPALAR